MALPASGAISLNQVNVELGNAGTASINMGSAAVRGLFGVASGAISMSDGYGKSNTFAFSITSSQTNANLRTLAVNAGWNQSIKVVATINGGVVMTSDTVGTPGLTINGSWPNGIELVNNGTIVGRGGNGGVGGAGGTGPASVDDSTAGSAGSAGGLALTISVAASIRNNGTIAGGGGGGGGGYATSSGGKDPTYTKYGGGGGGGGQSSNTNSSGAAGGAATASSGGAGGAGTFSLSGLGGTAGTNPNSRVYPNNAGGGGGGWGYNGIAGLRYFNTMGKVGGAGGGAGAATSGQANVTWLATGTRYGSLG